ncbi:MAG: hypothetical protein HGA45_06365 [Chloroflexales bacterium]|nr:hypothetical protein [Chloroflexales bacterium]
MIVHSPPRVRSRARPHRGLLGTLLDPIDRLAETIYSVLILLTFTLAFRLFKLHDAPGAPISSEYVHELLSAAFGAILAWGLIDGVVHALMELFQRGERHRLLRQVQAAESEQASIEVIAEELDYVLEPITGEDERHTLYRGVYAQLRTSRPRPVGFKREDFTGALGCVIVAVVAVLPSLLPLVLLRGNPALALRISNIVSFVVLFSAGYSWGRHTGGDPWKTGLLLVGAGAVTVAIAIALGG